MRYRIALSERLGLTLDQMDRTMSADELMLRAAADEIKAEKEKEAR